ncbi:hypothetical protein F8388_013650 [Cannabis sativa]|uniref:Major facilitator superfamily (MFS) profile domain-containing protein n=1 Tax=Cannabis sativa TaxID=3483 RepID=A0A7J6EKN2_CANSA|nr:hypothetical protein F8388_013650 [Cannabis sativa]
MAIGECIDVENGEIMIRNNNNNNILEDLEQPLIINNKKVKKIVAYEDEDEDNSTVDESGSIGMVLFSTFVAVCGSFEFGSCVGFSAPTQSAIRESLNLSLAQAMRISAGFCITGWLAVYLAKGAMSLDMGRLFTGYGIGIFSYVLMIVLGASFAFIIGTAISWRSLALTGLVPCIVLLIGLHFVPESPRWLAKAGHEKEFQASLQRLRGKGADITSEAAEIQVYIETLHSLPKASVVDLFQSKYIRSVTIGVGLMIFQQFGGINGIGFYVSETFTEAGKVSATGTFLGCFMAGTSFLLKASSRDSIQIAKPVDQGLLLEWAPLIAVAGVLIFIASFSIGLGAVPWVIMSEIFPIHVKGIAGSMVVMVNWLGAWAISYTYNFFMSWSAYGTYFIYSGFSLLAVLFVAILVPETKGKTLEEIQACINADRRKNQVLN